MHENDPARDVRRGELVPIRLTRSSSVPSAADIPAPAPLPRPGQGYVPAAAISHRRRRVFLVCVLIGLGAAALPFAVRSLRPYWWEGSWRCVQEVPALDLSRSGGSPVGQLVLKHGDAGFKQSLAVVHGQHEGDLVLLAVEPKGEAAGPPPVVYAAYLLVKRGENDAELYKLNLNLGDAQVRVTLTRPHGPTPYSVLIPSMSSLDKHKLVARLTKVSAGGRGLP